jgi:transcriptional regulator of acetoin/glycerol metabolism
VELRDLPDAVGDPATPAPAPPVVGAAARLGRKSPEPPPSVAELETLLEQHGGQVAEVSRALGRQRAAVWRWIKQWGLKPEKFRPKSR